MKFKVTVELEEGIKYTRTGSLTSEVIILLLKQQLKGDSNSSHVSSTELGKQLIKSAGELGQAAMLGIIKVMDQHGIVFEYNKRLSEYDKDGNAALQRCVHVITDVNEFLELKKKLKKDEL